MSGDTLSAVNREKLTMTATRDRHLQEQRKRKAAAFLTRMKQADVSQTAEDAAVECASDAGVDLRFYFVYVGNIV